MHRVLVLGVPRSGTTWVGDALGHCDEAAYVHEPDGVHDPFAFRAKTDIPVGGVLTVGSSYPRYQQLWAGAFAGGAKAATLRDHAARRLYSRVTTEQRAAFRDTGQAAFKLKLSTALAVPRVQGDSSVRSVVVKSVDAALAAPWIVDQFRPTVLVVTRDLRSVLSSWLRLGMQGPRQPGYEAIGAYAASTFGVEIPDFASSALLRTASVCAVWITALQHAAERRGWRVVAHEWLCDDSAVRFASLASDLGLGFGDRAKQFLIDHNEAGEGFATRRIASDSVAAWRSKLDAEQVDAIETVLALFDA